MSSRIGRSVRRSTSSGSYRILSVLAISPEGEDALIVTLYLYDADGEFLKRATGDNFDTMVRIGNSWLRDLALADAIASGDTAKIHALQVSSPHLSS